MYRFLKLVFICVVVLFLGNVVVYLLIGKSDTSRFNNYYNTVLKAENRHYKVVITGDSHANDCWRNFKSDSVLDLSFPGDNYLDVKKKLEFLKINNISYDNHLFEVDPQMFSSYREFTNNNDLSSSLSNARFSVALRKYLPLFFNPRLIEDCKNSIQGNKITDDLIIKPIDTSKIETRAQNQFISRKYSQKMMEEFLVSYNLVKESGAANTLINYPFYEQYLNKIDSTDCYSTIYKTRENFILSSKANFFNLEKALCDPNNFFNQDHVNQNGAQIIIPRILNEIERSKTFEVCID